MSSMGNTKQKQRGAVSIFIVVFSSLLVTVIVVSFVSLMIRAQQQAMNADLSQSAYDSALAGVEDAKSVLLKYRKCLSDSDAYINCTSIKNLFSNEPKCNMIKQAMTEFDNPSDNTEMLIQSSDASNGTDTTSSALDQAYTCVLVRYTADQKELDIDVGATELIPIETADEFYSAIEISWFVKEDGDNRELNIPIATSLPQSTAAWNTAANRVTPSVLRAQWIQHGEEFDASGFDSDSGAEANTKTLFLYPSTGSVVDSFNFDTRGNSPGTKSSQQVKCNKSNYDNSGYACSARLTIPDAIGSSDSHARAGYLQLGALYNATKVKISLLDTNGPVEIVAPTIDSTGRANDLFRRVKVGVSFTGDYPRANFDVMGNLCKNFSVAPDYYHNEGCDPNNPSP
jgi:hypothetical protein